MPDGPGQPRRPARGAAPAAYLRGIARHLASRHFRAVARGRLLDDFIDVAWNEDPEDELELARQALARCLEDAPERVRRLLDLRYREALSSKQIAESLGTTSDTVRVMLMRARQALARCIGNRLAAGGADG